VTKNILARYAFDNLASAKRLMVDGQWMSPENRVMSLPIP